MGKIFRGLLTAIALVVAFAPIACADLASADAAYDSENYSSAYLQYRQLARAGIARAQIRLAELYTRGRGTIQDPERAFHWYQQAAEQGDAEGQLALGELYRNGMGVRADDVQAHAWFNVAAAQGHERAAKLREIVAASLTSEELTRASELARRYYNRYLAPFVAGGDSIGWERPPEEEPDYNQLRVAYTELRNRYRRLVGSARTAEGKQVVTVVYDKRGGVERIHVKRPEGARREPVSDEQLHGLLAEFRDRYPGRLYVRIVIPANSELSYDAAWNFTRSLLESYDSDFRAVAASGSRQ